MRISPVNRHLLNFNETVTEYNKHCHEFSKTMSLDYDAVVLLSGDGLVREVFNGFAEREDALDAFEIPVIQIPTGSANGLSLCLLGLKVSDL